MSYNLWCLSYDDVWVHDDVRVYDDVWVYDDVRVYDDVWVMMMYELWCLIMMHDDVRNVYISMYDVLDMFDALYSDMMSMMIAWRLS